MSRQPTLTSMGPGPKRRPFVLRKDHGGDLRLGRRKEARPIDPKRPLHVTFKSKRARGMWSMLRPGLRKHVRHIIEVAARKSEVRILKFVNVGNHLHVLLRVSSRTAAQRFLRRAAGQIAMTVTGARKGHPASGRFWDRLAWSGIVDWGRHFKRMDGYFLENLCEALGLRDFEGSRVRGWTMADVEAQCETGPPDNEGILEEIWMAA